MEKGLLCALVCICVPSGVGSGGRRLEDVSLHSRLKGACVTQLVVDTATDDHGQHKAKDDWQSNSKAKGYMEPVVRRRGMISAQVGL